MSYLLLVLLLGVIGQGYSQCIPSVTTASGTHAPVGTICSGQLIFQEEFNDFNLDVWQHENTLAGGGNWEFQYYLNNRSNSFVSNGQLQLRPTLLADTHGEEFLWTGTLNLHGGAPADECTNPQFYGCERGGNPTNYLNPIKSARVRTVNSFNFKYGQIEIRAKNPSGDWLWPALWMLPKTNSYGTWPASGEIDLMESRGNRGLYSPQGQHIGVEQVGQTLHFGPYHPLNGWPTATFDSHSPPGNGWNLDFHRYQMDWRPDRITFMIDDVVRGYVYADNGFWYRGGWHVTHPTVENPWRYATTMAPFDKEFYILMNLAVGGTAYFPDEASNPGGKPWHNTSPQASTDFWRGRGQWLPGWNLGADWSREASLIVDYVRVWAV